MPSIPRGVLKTMAGGGDRPKDRWEPSTTKDSPVRLYRYEATVESGGLTTVEKRLFYTRMLHFGGKGVAPVECTGGSLTCEKCRKAALTRAQNTPDSEQQAQDLDATFAPTFVVVPLLEPTRFRTFDPRFSATQGILLCLAQAGGFRSSKYPDAKAWDEGNETGPMFDRAVEAGCGIVCGPKGHDIILTPEKKGSGFTWKVSRMPDGNTVLPFEEDSKVLNPEEVRKRIKAAVATKAAGQNAQKEGDA